ncbi:hypothetical protein [Deinococcus sp. UR1]|uniref:hypothetical protein n=1 Tax=Deinococcus sp. UR1 TaxID=1704277 RepID=UPI000C18D6C3|nr:hypothetical protein [Deinococcus sp. UR1]PIG96862.1 hypothetical protein AMD26_015135 [Deinococcus sp. UR1]
MSRTLYADTPETTRRGYMTRGAYYGTPEDRRGVDRWPSGAADKWVLLDGQKVVVRLYASADQFPLDLADLHLPAGARVAYAYSPNETANSRGGTHLYWDTPLQVGRMKRAAGVPLCGKKTHWGLEPQTDAHVSCVACAAAARRLFPARVDMGSSAHIITGETE